MVSKGKIRAMGDQFITFFRRDIGGKNRASSLRTTLFCETKSLDLPFPRSDLSLQFTADLFIIYRALKKAVTRTAFLFCAYWFRFSLV
jgi:hypothetical protein